MVDLYIKKDIVDKMSSPNMIDDKQGYRKLKNSIDLLQKEKEGFTIQVAI
jgi:hypothetical protein